MDKPAKALAATLLLTVASVALAWQGQLVWSQGLLQSGRSQDAPASDSAPSDIRERLSAFRWRPGSGPLRVELPIRLSKRPRRCCPEIQRGQGMVRPSRDRP